MLIFKKVLNKMIIFDINKIKAMKKILLLSLLALFIYSCNTQNSQTAEESSTVKVMDTMLIYVMGMTCSGCENTVQKSIAELPGVDSVKAGHVNGYTIVIFDTLQANYKDFSKAITGKGYEVDGYCSDINLDEMIIE